jgi:hypothetical protein
MSNVIDAAEEQVERFPASRYLSVHVVVIIVLDWGAERPKATLIHPPKVEFILWIKR